MRKGLMDRLNMNELKQKEHPPKTTQHKQIKVGKWNESLKTSDVNQIWAELHRIVSSHPLVRASKRAGFLVEEGKFNAYTDLTQEIFVALLKSWPGLAEREVRRVYSGGVQAGSDTARTNRVYHFQGRGRFIQQ